jgi:hypothetical protein
MRNGINSIQKVTIRGRHAREGGGGGWEEGGWFIDLRNRKLVPRLRLHASAHAKDRVLRPCTKAKPQAYLQDVYVYIYMCVYNI